MAEFKFSEEPSLGQVVNPGYKVFCNWSPKTPIKNVYKITRDVCGHKFSTICGFTFTSSLDVPFFVKYPELKLNLQYGIDSITFYPTFQVVYCPKSRSNYVRNDRGLSGWYLWQHRAVDNKQIMSLRDLYAYYGFDVAKFFQSDVFQKYLPLFKKQISAAYGTVVQDFLSNMKDDQFGYSVNNAKFFAKCTYDSLEKIGDVLKVNWEKPDQMKAKLAYNADDTYSLNAKSVPNLDQTSGVEATGTEMKTEESEEEVCEVDQAELEKLTAEYKKAGAANPEQAAASWLANARDPRKVDQAMSMIKDFARRHWDDKKGPFVVARYSDKNILMNLVVSQYDPVVGKVVLSPDSNAQVYDKRGESLPTMDLKKFITDLKAAGCKSFKDVKDITFVDGADEYQYKTYEDFTLKQGSQALGEKMWGLELIFKGDPMKRAFGDFFDESEPDEICEEGLDDPNEITEVDNDSEKSRKLWSKAENMFSEAAKAYDTLKTYMDLVTAAYTHDTTFVPDDAPTMPETKADIAKAGQAIIDLGSAFHFTEA